MTVIFIVVLALLLFVYLAIPLLVPGQSDTLPDLRDPVTQDLEEERDALLRAIRELDARRDLPEARRDALRARYEAKAAKVLRALDERQDEVAPPRPPRRRAALPLLALALLGAGFAGAALMAYRAPPEIVSADGSTPSISGRDLAELERAAARDPSEANLLALADGYWSVQNAEAAQATYERVVAEIRPVPALAFERLGLLQLQSNVGEALRYLELARNADPQNLEVLYFLGEIYYANEDMDAAAEAWESYLAAPGGAGDNEVEGRLDLARTFAPLLAAVQADPSEANLLALADGYWSYDERARAVEIYFQVLSEKDPHNAVALSRVGQQLFFGGRFDDAIAVLRRAREVAPDDLQTLLFLGNAHFSLGEYRRAIEVWRAYVEVAGGPERAGRVPGLIADAQERLRSGAPPPTDPAAGEAPADTADAAGAAAPLSAP
jgi:tetratricopeptide (TPR) repeat protein